MPVVSRMPVNSDKMCVNVEKDFEKEKMYMYVRTV